MKGGYLLLGRSSYGREWCIGTFRMAHLYLFVFNFDNFNKGLYDNIVAELQRANRASGAPWAKENAFFSWREIAPRFSATSRVFGEKTYDHRRAWKRDFFESLSLFSKTMVREYWSFILEKKNIYILIHEIVSFNISNLNRDCTVILHPQLCPKMASKNAFITFCNIFYLIWDFSPWVWAFFRLAFFLVLTHSVTGHLSQMFRLDVSCIVSHIFFSKSCVIFFSLAVVKDLGETSETGWTRAHNVVFDCTNDHEYCFAIIISADLFEYWDKIIFNKMR